MTMLYPDAQRRIDDINRMANLFKEKGYSRTCKEILSFAEILKGKKVPPDFLKKLDLLFDMFRGEFTKNVSIGQNYRNQCFQEIKGVIFGAIAKTHPHFGQLLVVLLPFIRRLNDGRRILDDIAEWLTPKKIPDKELRVHLACYAYLITVEGLFDELARILYFFVEVSKGITSSVQDLEKITVWDVLNELKPTPIFLQNWKEKKHIRNAIGHARVYYDPEQAQIRFVDLLEKSGKVTYDKTIPMARFFEMGLELEDSVVAFYYIIIMLRLHDLILSKDAYQ